MHNNVSRNVLCVRVCKVTITVKKVTILCHSYLHANRSSTCTCKVHGTRTFFHD